MINETINSLDLKKAYIFADGVISRTNQDGTVILMKLSDVKLFYKVDKIAARVWTEFETIKTVSGIIEHFTSLAQSHSVELSRDIQTYAQELLGLGMIEEAKDSSKANESFAASSIETNPYDFGGMKTYDLEEIETEVLNESIYLDVFAGSDLALKTNLEPIEDALGKIRRLEGVHFTWEDGSISQSKQTGVIAQHVAAEMPELVRADAKSGRLAVNYIKLNTYLLEAVKTLAQRVEDLERKLETNKK